MKIIKNKIKKDFIEKLDVDLKFDNSKLIINESNTKKNPTRKNVFKVLAVCLIVGILAIPASAFISIFVSVDETFKHSKVKYTLHELKHIESESFIKINDVSYPDEKVKNNDIDDNFIQSIIDFTNDIYNESLVENKNYSFSPITLYSNLAILSLASNDININNKFDSLLNCDKITRTKNYKKMFENNFFAHKSGTTQMYNGLFLNDKYDINSNFINGLVDYYCQAYKLNFSNPNDIEKMLEWVDEKVLQDNYIDQKDLNLNEYSAMYLFSTLYFNNSWAYKFNKKDTVEKPFILSNQSSVNANYMYHEYLVDYIYDYGDYISFYDYYSAGTYSIKYIVPKSTNDNIYDLIKGKNILIDAEENKILPSSEVDFLSIKLSVPKFESNMLVDFTKPLINLGMGELFDKNARCFNDAFVSLDNETSIYLDFIKQKNNISFNEDGTVIKSVTFSGLRATNAGPISVDTYEINLNQPFVYIIYDKDSIPIYLGHLDNPNIQ